jgi:hypothetical protein
MLTSLRHAVAGLGAFALLAAGCHAATVPGVAVSPAPAADTTIIRRDVNYLASDALAGRLTGTPGNDSAAAYIARRYAVLGLQPLAVHTDSICDAPESGHARFACASPYLQPFAATSVAAVHAGLAAALPSQNVVAMVRGSDPALRDQYVVIGAHFDHLGHSTFGAMDPEAGNAIRHGADDNASGTAAVMELARLFVRHPARRSIVFVNFSGEELGLLGSEYFVEHSPVPMTAIRAMLNFDMVGRMRNDRLIVYGVATATGLSQLVDSANIAPAFQLTAIGDGFGPSDQSSFYADSIPVLHFFTDIHEDYHRATDVAAKVDVADEARVVNFAARIARALADGSSRLTYVRTAPPPHMATSGNAAVYFGSIPDMGAADVTGVRMAGVSPGGPADQAGVRKGDIIVEFGGVPVKDLYAYTDALRAHAPGDSVAVVVLRGTERLTLTAVLGTRQ